MSEPSHAASPRFVKCPDCGTKLGVRAEDAGRRGQCHECGRVFWIGAPPAAANHSVPPAPPVHPPSPGRGLGDYDNDHLHPVSCLVCQTLMYATDDQVGKKVKCPDCGAMNLAQRRQVKKPKPSPLVADGDEYQLDESSAPPPTPRYTPIEEREAQYRAAAHERLGRRSPVVAPPATLRNEPREAAARATPAGNDSAALPAPPKRAPLPRRLAVPVVQGVWRMLFTSEVMVRWFALSVVLMLIIFLMSSAMHAMGNQAVFLLPIYAAGCVFGGFWILSASSLLVAILTQSANGADELSDPPSWFSVDLGEAAFLAMGGLVSGLPAWLATKLTPDWPLEANVALGTALWLATFPFVTLSALEQGSPLALFSPRLAASLGRCFVPWVASYLVACALVGGAGLLGWKLLTSSNALAMLPLAWLITAVLLTYMRIIGRLGWWIAEVMPAATDQSD